MDGREAMAYSGLSASYYLHGGGISGSGSGSQIAGLHAPPGFRNVANAAVMAQSNIGGSLLGSTFATERSHSDFTRGISSGLSPGVTSSEPVTKKRGRPRKYGPDGPVTLKLSPMSGNSNTTPEYLGTTTPKKVRGRPRGSGRKQQLATLGEWMNSSAGLAFAPHVIHIGAGEDIVEKILSFSQQRPRAVCVLSGNGKVSSVTLRQPGSTDISFTYEGHFQILSLSGSFLVAEDGGPQGRTGGIAISLLGTFSTADGQVVGGQVVGGSAAKLIAASAVQAVVCSFVYDGAKIKKHEEAKGPKREEGSESQQSGNLALPVSTPPPTQTYIPSATSVWPSSRSSDLRNQHTGGIDLMRG